MNRLALGLFIAAALLFAAFLGFPLLKTDDMRGWEVWEWVPGTLTDFGGSRDFRSRISTWSILLQSVIVTSSPFLLGVYRRSRLTWWLMTAMAGISSAGLIPILKQTVAILEYADFGFKALLLSSIVHFSGMLMVRGDRRE